MLISPCINLRFAPSNIAALLQPKLYPNPEHKHQVLQAPHKKNTVQDLLLAVLLQHSFTTHCLQQGSLTASTTTTNTSRIRHWVSCSIWFGHAVR
jgi:hypothetical protein